MATATLPGATLQPEWLAHRYDENADAIHFVQAERRLRQAVPFLTDEHLPAATAPRAVRRRDAMQAMPAPVPVHFVFHSAYCCSTLLATALDIEGCSTSCKEPQILNDIVGWRHRGADPARVGTVLSDVIRLVSRPFEAGECCIIKPSNIVNGLADAMLRMRPEAGAVLMHAPLRSFVVSIARKNMWGRLWVRELLSRQLKEGSVNLGFSPGDYFLQTDLQVAAVGWLAQQQLFQALIRQWPARVRSLSSETLVARPAETLAELSALFGLALDEDRIAGAVAAHFGRNAKDGAPFVPGQRESDRKLGEELHADEIDKVCAWAAAVAATAGVELDLPNPLLA